MAQVKRHCRNFNPLSPCGERPDAFCVHCTPYRISIHSPRVGRDERYNQLPLRPKYFNPLSPCGERLLLQGCSAKIGKISIHSPRVGRDEQWPSQKTREEIISIHSPRVGRDVISILTVYNQIFQSTLPVWGETLWSASASNSSRISIHSPRVGRDGRC